MPIYKIDAENVSRRKLVQLVREFEAKGVDIDYANMDHNFTYCIVMFITARERVAHDVQNRIWEVNNGLYCNLAETTGAELDRYIDA